MVARGKVLLGLMGSLGGDLHFVRDEGRSADDGGCAVGDSRKIHSSQTKVMEQTSDYSEIAGGGDDAPEYP